MWPTSSPSSVFRTRRARLARSLRSAVALLPAGRPRAKNFPANIYPFRAESHFLYLVGRSIAEAALLFAEPEPTLYVPPPDASDALWHGPTPSLDQLARTLALPVRPLSELRERVLAIDAEIATVSPNDDATAAWLSDLIGRPIHARRGADVVDGTADAELAEALIDLRLLHDQAAVGQLRQAAAATALADAGPGGRGDARRHSFGRNECLL